ncbi:unnamed protein product [Vitrella brassicaformis CCMP3155]|uniref:Proline dehydrogenase n=2 Tax=Vitrella brassicaformis TaxID=1169539 RepID=A0A0G4ESA6_VITBC|nr:unnamed protein product [Vitrella brassicaformis CCMP3155]|mmetsp:Transcript_18825/g.45324  ORF Transcript_18825/g.45324 Transcript_18825/m.45324 type:complete len:548 (+) Transcript_18825:161-1804(+)|eukprot:CEM00556.1 unnamed protein product [Vitrella brassicaformis CCMP3155]
MLQRRLPAALTPFTRLACPPATSTATVALPRSHQSTFTASPSPSAPHPFPAGDSGHSAPHHHGDIDFCDTSTSFKHKSSLELARSATIFNLCKVKPLVQNASKLIGCTRKVAGDQLTDWALKQTFFKQFCGGEQLSDLHNTMAALSSHGVGSILDYAAEKDLHSPSSTVSPSDINAELDINCHHTIDALRASQAQTAKGYAAVKLTSLATPQLLVKVSDVVRDMEAAFDAFIGVSTGEDRNTASLDRVTFAKKAAEVWGAGEWGEAFDKVAKDGRLGYAQFMGEFGPCGEHYGGAGLSEAEREEWAKVVERVGRVAAECEALGSVSVLIDAEQTYMQPAIEYVTLQAMRTHNKERAVVYNTYQGYLKKCEERLLLGIAQAHAEGFHLGVKLVRGAYMYQERRLAAEKGYEDPICRSLEDTHASYDGCVAHILDSLHRIEVVLGTHNEQSIKKAVAGLHLRGLSPTSPRVAFAQLLGMCDHITFKLGASGFAAYKYVPYGPIKEVLPYLLRRAEENSDLLGSSGKETLLILQELAGRSLHLQPRRRFA